MGRVVGDKDGTLEHAVNQGLYPYLVDDEGNWTVRQDVRNVAVMGSGGPGKSRVRKNDWLKVAGGRIGVEIGIGHHMGELHDEPVLIIKASQGNRSLGWDFLPPGSERFTQDGKTYAGYEDTPDSWVEGEPRKKVDWYAGKQYDDCFRAVHEVLNDYLEGRR